MQRQQDFQCTSFTNACHFTSSHFDRSPHLTAVQALYIHLRIAPPSAPITTQTSILIWGGSTAVGHHAVQLAALSGYKVFVTASPAAFEDLKALGASELFDYKDPDVAQKIKAAAGEQGITLAVDTVSENGTTELVVVCILLSLRVLV